MKELSLNVMDITQNSISAKATRVAITVDEDLDNAQLRIVIEDDGKGMTPQQVQSVIDPFYTTRTTRPVGLGIPLFKMEAEMTGGSLTVSSVLGKGTVITAVFCTDHIDMIPLGDMAATVLPLITGNPEIAFIYTRRRVRENQVAEFCLDTRQVQEILGDEVALTSPEVVLWLRDFLQENTAELLRI